MTLFFLMIARRSVACGHRSLHPAQPNSTVLRKRKRFLGRSNFVNAWRYAQVRQFLMMLVLSRRSICFPASSETDERPLTIYWFAKIDKFQRPPPLAARRPSLAGAIFKMNILNNILHGYNFLI